MDLKIEIAPDLSEEIVLRGPKLTEEIILLQKALQNALDGRDGFRKEIPLKLGETECFVPLSGILFFETNGSHVCAHTINNMYLSSYKLYELEAILPESFIRGSKSSLVNTAKISSIKHSITGASEVHFTGTDKIMYVSRNYYKELRNLIEKTRLN